MTPENEKPSSGFDTPMEARTGVTDIFGKLDDDLPSIRINGEVLDLMRRNARAAGCNLSEYIRNKLYVGEFGYEHVASLRDQQLRRVIGNAPHKVGQGGQP